MAPSKNKYRAELSLEDVRAWGQQMKEEYDIEVQVVFRLVGRSGGIVSIEVNLYEQSEITDMGYPAPLAHNRGQVASKATNIWPAVMFVCTQAWSIYLDNPWGYTWKHRDTLKHLPWK